MGDQIAERYRLLRPLAAGGMGEVWAAKNELTGRDFAIKFLLKEFAHSSEAFDRFVREAEITGKLQHPSIVDVFDVAQTEDGRPFIVMELLSGEDLETRLEREGTLSPLRTAAYFSQIATGLALAHRAGVVHRDLSASNIFLARQREGGEPIPKILDFGVSKRVGPAYDGQIQTLNGAVLGNPVYMSPEQAMGAENVDAGTDVWSLGIVMYQCLTGTVPFRSANYNALMVEIMTQAHRPIVELVPTIDRELVQLIEQCLQKDRANRPSSARELGARLGLIAQRLAGDPHTVSQSPRRRATDRLPPPLSIAEKAQEARRASEALPLGVRVFRSAAELRPSRRLVATIAGVAGTMFGICLAQLWQKPALAPHAVVTDVSAASANASDPAKGNGNGDEAIPTSIDLSSLPVVPNRENAQAAQSDLGEAMARGIRGEKK